MHKEQIKELRWYAANLRERVEKIYCDENINIDTALEKECIIFSLQLLPCFIEGKPMFDEKSKRWGRKVKEDLINKLSSLIDITNDEKKELYGDILHIFQLMEFSGFKDEEPINLFPKINYELMDTNDFVPSNYFKHKDYYFGNTNDYYKHHRKKTIFD